MVKSQSAMEYLMTYGWAILIIAVVLGALFQLGVFSGIGTPKAQAGNCQVVKVGTGITQTISLTGECQGQEPEYVTQFNGKNSGINLNPFPTTLSPITVSAWIYPTHISQTGYGYAQGAAIIDGNENGINTGYVVGIKSTGKLWWWPYSGGDKYSTNNVVLNAWTFITVTCTGTTLKMYLNGNLDSSQSTGVVAKPTLLKIGARSWTTGYFQGSISNVQIYNTTLSQAEVTALYDEGIGGAPIDPRHLVGWWPLNGDTRDYSGNDNNGQPTNVVYTSSWTSGYTAP